MYQLEPSPLLSTPFILIYMIFGIYNKLPLYFKFKSITMWYLTGFHGNQNYINYVTISRLFKFDWNIILKMVGIHKIARIHCKVSVFSHFFSEKLKFHSQSTMCVSYYDVINCDVA